MLLSEDSRFLNRPEIRLASRTLRHPRLGILWTDDHNNLFSILRWKENLVPTLALWGKGWPEARIGGNWSFVWFRDSRFCLDYGGARC
jgi:hypothetical protein